VVYVPIVRLTGPSVDREAIFPASIVIQVRNLLGDKLLECVDISFEVRILPIATKVSTGLFTTVCDILVVTDLVDHPFDECLTELRVTHLVGIPSAGKGVSSNDVLVGIVVDLRERLVAVV
jgi:hypothetical protein